MLPVARYSCSYASPQSQAHSRRPLCQGLKALWVPTDIVVQKARGTVTRSAAQQNGPVPGTARSGINGPRVARPD
jgi:hypothetical protein